MHIWYKEKKLEKEQRKCVKDIENCFLFVLIKMYIIKCKGLLLRMVLFFTVWTATVSNSWIFEYKDSLCE